MNYYTILVWVGAAALFANMAGLQRTEIVLGKREKRYPWLWIIIVLIPLWIMAMNRSWIGDTETYRESFREMPELLSGFSGYMASVTKDEGFYALSALIKIFITSNDKIYFLILAVLQSCMLLYVYRKYSSKCMISLFLFLASTDYISWMFNGIRQFTAVVITFAACELILKKKYVPAILTILLASTFHGTALLLIPFVFIVQGKAWNRRTIFFILAIIVVVSSIGEFTNVLDSMLQETQYKNVVSDWQEWEDDGTNLFRVLVYTVPVILSLVGLKYIRQEDDPLINMCTNMSIVSMGFYIVSMFTSGIFIGRLPVYFSLYNYILLPWEIEHIFEKKSAQLVYICMFIGYIGFYFYSLRGFSY